MNSNADPIDALRILPGFMALDDAALRTIIARSVLRRFAPGQRVVEAGQVSETLFARIEGELVSDSQTVPPVFDAPGLLFGLAVDEACRAGPAGFVALAIAKPHVFTIVREFPEFTLSLLDQDEAGR